MPVTDFQAGADTQGLDIFWVAETAWGTVPAGPPTLNTLRTTGHGLEKAKTTVRSAEISSDAEISDRILTSFNAQGPINFEFSLDAPGGGHLIDLMEGALWGTFTADLGIGPIAIDAASGDNSFNDPIAAGTMFASAVVGQWIRVKGFATNPVNNGVFQIVTKPSADKITVSGATLVTEVGSSDETITGQMLRGAKIANSYVIEVAQVDTTPDILQAYTGMMVDQLQMTFDLEAVVTGSFTFLGKDRLAATATTVGDGTPTARSTTAVSETVNDTGSIRRASAALSGVVRNLTLNVNRGLRRQGGIGLQGAAQGLGVGVRDVTGTLEAYMLDKTLIDAFDGHTFAQLDWQVSNDAGATLVTTIPEMVLSSGGNLAGGQDQDVTDNYNWEARKDGTLGHSIQMDYLPA